MKYKNICKMGFINIYIFILFSIARSGYSTKITKSMKPISIENGSTSGIVIDCPYELSTEERKGIEIKWFYSNKPNPVYQWVPGNKPQSFGRLQKRVNLSYELSKDDFKKHRALSILMPTLELSGTYTCQVSSFSVEINFEILLTVYTSADKLYANFESIDHDTIQISCNADGLSPEPSLALYRMIPSSGTYRFEESETGTEYDHENKTYSISLERNFKHSELEEGDFLCSLTIPNTEYQLDREIAYCPDGAAATTSMVNLITLSLLAVFYSCWYSIQRS